MKSKDKKQLIGKTIMELKDEVKRLQNEVTNLHMDKIQGKLKDTSSLTNKRKDIAVIKTVMRVKEMSNESI